MDLLPPIAAGDLARSSMAELLAAAFRTNATGTLAVEQGAGESRLFVRYGIPCGAHLYFQFRSLGQLLGEQGRLDADTLDRTLATSVESGRRHGEVLVEEGLLTSEELLATLLELQQENVHRLCLLREGRYELRGWERPPEWTEGLALDPLRTVIAAFGEDELFDRRAAVLEALAGTRLRLADGYEELAVRVALEPTERRSLAALGIPRRLEEIGAGLLDRQEAETFVVAAALLGLVEVDDGRPRPAPAEPLRPVPESENVVDASELLRPLPDSDPGDRAPPEPAMHEAPPVPYVAPVLAYTPAPGYVPPYPTAYVAPTPYPAPRPTWPDHHGYTDAPTSGPIGPIDPSGADAGRYPGTGFRERLRPATLPERTGASIVDAREFEFQGGESTEELELDLTRAPLQLARVLDERPREKARPSQPPPPREPPRKKELYNPFNVQLAALERERAAASDNDLDARLDRALRGETVPPVPTHRGAPGRPNDAARARGSTASLPSAPPSNRPGRSPPSVPPRPPGAVAAPGTAPTQWPSTASPPTSWNPPSVRPAAAPIPVADPVAEPPRARPPSSPPPARPSTPAAGILADIEALVAQIPDVEPAVEPLVPPPPPPPLMADPDALAIAAAREAELAADDDFDTVVTRPEFTDGAVFDDLETPSEVHAGPDSDVDPGSDDPGSDDTDAFRRAEARPVVAEAVVAGGGAVLLGEATDLPRDAEPEGALAEDTPPSDDEAPVDGGAPHDDTPHDDTPHDDELIDEPHDDEPHDDEPIDIEELAAEPVESDDGFVTPEPRPLAPEEEAARADLRRKLFARAFRNVASGVFERPEESSPPAGAAVEEPAKPTGVADPELEKEILARVSRLPTEDHFSRLGLKRTATTEDVKKAFLVLAKQFHPDRLVAQGQLHLLGPGRELFAKVKESYDALVDPAARARYAAQLEAKEGGARKRDPEEAKAAFQKAVVYLRKRDLKHAEAELVQAVELDPQAEYLAELAWTLQSNTARRDEAHEEIRSLVKRSLEASPDHERAYVVAGLVAKVDGDVARAERFFRRAIAKNPKSVEAARELRLMEMRKPAPKQGLLDKLRGR